MSIVARWIDGSTRLIDGLMTSMVWVLLACGRLDSSALAIIPPTSNDHSYVIDTWETDDGLPENSATAMAQTPDGYLWFGTFNGLVRFDGVTFKVFDPSNTPELPSASIVNLHLDNAGWLWVSTYRGVVLLKDGKWRNLADNDGWVGDFVRTFTERGNGDLLLTTYDGHVLDCSGGRFTELTAPPGNRKKGCFGAADEGGHWWILRDGYLGWWDGDRWSAAVTSPLPSDDGCCGPARDGGIWVFAQRELRKYRGGIEVSRRELPEQPGGIWSLFEDSESNVWICTLDSGLCRIAPDGEVRRWTTANGLRYDGTRFVFEDREHNLWIGTSGGGLTRFKPRRFRTYGIEEGVAERVVSSVAPSGSGGLWIATYGKGVFRLEGDRIENVALPGLSNVPVYAQSVLADHGGRTWVGTFSEGLWLLDQSGTKRIPADQTGGGNIISLFEDSRGRIWIGGGEAVSVFDGEHFAVYDEDQGLPPSGICCFAEDGEGVIWLSNLAGVFRLEHERFVEVRDDNGKPLVEITCLKPDAGGTMWMGSRTSGLLRWRAGLLARIDERVGLPVRAVHGMLEDDDGFWWMASNRGVVRARRSDLEAVADGKAATLKSQHFNTEDGLASVECAGGKQPVCARTADGRLWFATLKGVATVDPKTLHLNQEPPPTLIEELAWSGPATQGDRRGSANATAVQTRVTAPFPGSIVLSAGTRQLEISYTGLSFVAPEKVRFQIMLEGQDEHWQDAGTRRTAEYHNLGPGGYVFHVRAANNDGLWNETGASLAFTLQPFYWQTWGFRGAVLVTLLAGTAGIAWRVSGAKQRTRREVDERSRLMVEAAPNAMIMVNADGLIMLANAQAEQDFGYRRNELIDSPVEMLLPERFQRVHRSLRSNYFLQPTARSMGAGLELFGRHRSGSEFPVEIGLNPIQTAAGPFVLASIINISERKRAERESQQQRNELAHLSRVTMLGELSGSLSHELNQPLTAILSNAQAALRFLANDQGDIDEVRLILEDIVSEDKRAGEIIRRLRLLLKKGEVNLQPLNMNEVVQDALKLIRSDLMNHGITLRAELDEAIPAVSGDRVQLQQVLLNLIINASDAMSGVPTEGRQLLVRTMLAPADGVQVSVVDNGSGIPPEALQRVFEPFFTTKSLGMGLGLAVCNTIIVAHHGRLWAVNNIDRGATFCFALPVHHEKTP